MLQTIGEYIKEYDDSRNSDLRSLLDGPLTDRFGEDYADTVMDCLSRMYVDGAARARHVANLIKRGHGEFDYPELDREISMLVRNELTHVMLIHEELGYRTHACLKDVDDVHALMALLVHRLRRDDFVLAHETDPVWSGPCLSAIDFVLLDEAKPPRDDVTAQQVVQIRNLAMRYVPMKPDPTRNDFVAPVRRAVLELGLIG